MSLTLTGYHDILFAMDTTAQYYEISYLLKPTIGEEALPETESVLKQAIESIEGLIESADMPVKRRIAYLIGGFHDVFFGAIRFTANPEKVHALEEKFNSVDAVIRHLTVKWQRPQLRTVHRTPNLTYTPKKEEQTETDIAALDKQLEEILKE